MKKQNKLYSALFADVAEWHTPRSQTPLLFFCGFKSHHRHQLCGYGGMAYAPVLETGASSVRVQVSLSAPMQVWYNGSTLASQAKNVGSTPITCSSK